MNRLTPRTWTYIFAGAGLLALVLLAISLNALQLAPGQPVSFQDLAPQVSSGGGDTALGRFLMAAFRVFMILFWIVAPILLIVSLLDKEGRKRFLIYMAIVLPFLLLLFYASSQKATQKAVQDINLGSFSVATPEAQAGGSGAPTPTFTPPASWVTTAATVTVAVVISFSVIAVVFTIWRNWNKQKELQGPLKQVQREAQAALDAIYAGGDLKETILRCYLQMVEALKQYRGISRDYDMTPHEFELYLEKRGLPGEPVHQLTQLFEQVRYGATQPGRQDERIAVSSLSAIISACQKPRSA